MATEVRAFGGIGFIEGRLDRAGTGGTIDGLSWAGGHLRKIDIRGRNLAADVLAPTIGAIMVKGGDLTGSIHALTEPVGAGLSGDGAQRRRRRGRPNARRGKGVAGLPATSVRNR